MSPSLLTVLAVSVLLAALARRWDLSSPLVLVVAGLAVGSIPGVADVVELQLDPHLVLFVVLPPLLWSAGLQSSYISLRRSIRPIGLLAVGLPLATTAVVGVVAYHVVPDLTLAAALVLGAIVAPPDAVSASAIGRRLGLPRRIMTLLGGESLLNDATALTAYKVSLAAAIGTAATWQTGLRTFALAAVGGVVVGVVLGRLLVFVRAHLHDAIAESATGLIAPFLVYQLAEEIDGSGVLAVVVAALILAQRVPEASYATRLQETAVWRALQLVLESFAFLLIGLQLPAVVAQLRGFSAALILSSAVAVFVAVVIVRILWVYPFAYLPRMLSRRIRETEPAPSRGQVFIVAWAGMRGVVSLAAAFGVPLTTMTGADFPGRPMIVFLTFVVVVGTLLLHGLTLPWLIRRLGGRGTQARADAVAAATAQDRAAQAAVDRLDELVAEGTPEFDTHAADVLRAWNDRRRRAAWDRIGPDPEAAEPPEHESPTGAFRTLRLEMLAAERAAFIAERDDGNIDDEVLRAMLHGLDLEEAVLNRG